MNFARCEQCGAKALIAASQCPRCTHPLGLRDSRGQAVPLAHCHKCDTYYPRSLGGCRWCGTKATSVTVPPRVIVAAMVVLLAVGATAVWQWRSRAPVAAAEQVGAAPLPLDSSAAASAAPNAAPTATPTAVPVEPAPSSRTDMRSPVVAVPPTDVATRRYAGPWTRAVATNWVNVRASNSPASAVLGVVTPNTMVQLGELRAGWRRVRSAGVEGWADARFFASDSTAR